MSGELQVRDADGWGYWSYLIREPVVRRHRARWWQRSVPTAGAEVRIFRRFAGVNSDSFRRWWPSVEEAEAYAVAAVHRAARVPQPDEPQWRSPAAPPSRGGHREGER